MLRLKHCVFLVLFLPATVWAQLTVFPLEGNRKKPEPKNYSSARTQEELRSLPFWDDFSYAEDDHPQDTMWINNRTVYVNSGQAINPPTINVASFDGLNELGLPYNSTDNLDYGYRDTLESQPIKMTEVLLPDQNSVFLSFSYQAGGHGEPPDPGDFLRLEFKKDDGTWEIIETFTTEDDLDPAVFYDTLIRINQPEYFHDDFRFRFISFGRKSGRYDSWHLDYVYLNKGRDENDRSRPDRAIATKLTTLFEEYYCIPKIHLDSSRVISAPQFEAYNLRDFVPTTTTYQIIGKFFNFSNGIPSIYTTQIGPEFPGINGGTSSQFLALERKNVPVYYLPDPNDATQFDYSSDSIKVSLSVKLLAGDVFQIDPFTGISTGELALDYNNPKNHTPIDFRANDTTSHSYTIKDYYAYDDGIAEYAAGLTTTGNRLAYGFAMKTTSQDTINALNIYFSNFVGEHSSTVEFFILDHDNGLPGAVLHEQLLSVTPKPNNEFSLTKLNQGVIVKDTFFIGYRQPTGASIRIGLDKGNDSGSRMYDNTNGTWVQNDRVTGSLMIRPRFGPGKVVITGLPEAPKPVTLYPNPNRGTFYMKGVLDYVQVVNITGQAVELVTEDLGEEKRITIPGASSGLYIVRYKSGSRIFTEKIFITK